MSRPFGPGQEPTEGGVSETKAGGLVFISITTANRLVQSVLVCAFVFVYESLFEVVCVGTIFVEQLS